MEKHMNSKTFQLVLTSLMIAVAFVLNRIIPGTPVYHLTLDFLPIFAVAVICGPVWAAIAYGIADTVGSILIPFGPYNPGITLSLMFLGLIYGLVFYHKNMKGRNLIFRTLLASFLTFLVKLFITTFFLYLMYGGESFFAYVVTRIPNCLAIAVANLILLPLVYKLLIERIKITA